MSNPLIVVVSSSLAVHSRSRIAADFAATALRALACDVDVLNLAAVHVAPYPRSEAAPETQDAVKRFNAAHGWVLSTPIYNFGVSGVLLNFLHYALDSDRGRWKPFTIISSMAGQRSHLATDHLARTMTYEVSAMQVGPAVVSVGDAGIHRTSGEMSPEVRERIEKAMAPLAHYARARMLL